MCTAKTLFDYYLSHQDELVDKYNGKFIVITADGVAGDYDSDEDAYFEAVEKYGLGNFIVQYCTAGKDAYTQNFTSRVRFA